MLNSETLTAITKYLDMGTCSEWDEEKKLEFLTRELKGKRLLVPPSMEGTLRSTEQGEMVQSKFGQSITDCTQTAGGVLLATLHPPHPPQEQKCSLMEEISKISCQNYWSVVYKNPELLT